MAVSLGRGRIAFGVVSVLAPGVVGRTMTGREGSDGGMRLFLRMVGARDLALGLGLLLALDRDAPTRGWLEAPWSTGSMRPHAYSPATTFVEACSPAQSAWRPPARYSTAGSRGNSTPRRPDDHSSSTGWP